MFACECAFFFVPLQRICMNRKNTYRYAAVLVTILLVACRVYAAEQIICHSAQTRLGARFTKQWDKGLKLGFDEELRFDMYNSLTGASFNHSYTTLYFAYAPIEYVSLDAGYMLKIHGPNKTWSDQKRADYNQWLRHRIFFSVSGNYKTEYVKFSLRERALLEMRTDSINPLEKNKYNWELRSRIYAEIYVPNPSVKPYAWVEIINTLNAPEYQQIHKDNNLANKGYQYISCVRTQIGVKWRLTSLSSLDFYYRLTYSRNRDVNFVTAKGNIDLTEVTLYQHAICVTYDLNW